ncbi:glutenin, low molecular weight subunit-like [Humulus lupulus]|uniref:glutenin, low molecular weight subunit-like n=1 Tax=Humulus lupulus TaxID=3486 RepID=UPI002B4074BD|nr:glutenin, low molecular weight subunit-like [Humulus lupulus]
MDRRQRDATAALEVAIQLARGQPTLASQSDQPPNTHPQQNPHSKHPQHHHNLPQPMNPQGSEQPPDAQQERPFYDLEQQPSSRADQNNTQQQRQNWAKQHPRSPGRQMAEEQNPPSRGQRPLGSKSQVESGSAVRGPPRHKNFREPTDQHRRNASRRQEERGEGQNPPPMENQPIRQNVGGQPKQPNVFDRLGVSEQRRREEDLRDVLNDRRKRHDEYFPQHWSL